MIKKVVLLFVGISFVINLSNAEIISEKKIKNANGKDIIVQMLINEKDGLYKLEKLVDASGDIPEVTYYYKGNPQYRERLIERAKENKVIYRIIYFEKDNPDHVIQAEQKIENDEIRILNLFDKNSEYNQVTEIYDLHFNPKYNEMIFNKIEDGLEKEINYFDGDKQRFEFYYNGQNSKHIIKLIEYKENNIIQKKEQYYENNEDGIYKIEFYYKDGVLYNTIAYDKNGDPIKK
jgi:hypothetical protein